MPTLHWIGKDKVIKHHHDVPFRVLNHQYTFSNTQGDDSISENKIIHGDNLEGLKALLPYYEGKVKCIYIDPPYNTGNEGWVYNDNVNDPKMKKWLGKVVGKEFEDLTRHDKWLCMMYPRLKLLHKLLAPDGAIFVSIDDNEQAILKLLMDDIFGSGNFVTQIVWKGKGGGADNKYLMQAHEYITIFAKNKGLYIVGEEIKEGEVFSKFDPIRNQNYKTQLARKWGSNSRRVDRPNLFYSVLSPDGQEINPILPNGEDGCWRWSKVKMQQEIQLGNVEFIKTSENNWIVYEKIFQPKEGEYNTKKYSTWFDNLGSTATGSKELKEIFEEKIFDYPKPPVLIETLIKISGNSPNAIILDSFAGSGTTAQAVLNLNKADGGNRKFILIEMEDYAETITAERVKRVINGYGNVEGTGGDFNYYELGESLFDEDRNINENLPIETLRDYIWYVETKNSLSEKTNENHQQPYFLDKYQETAYFFIYEKEHITTLDYDFLEHVNIQAEQYVMYADNCTLSEAFRREKHIIFKKISRDISRF